MTATVTCGYDATGKFYAKVDGDSLAQIVSIPDALHSELANRLIADPPNVTPSSPTAIASTPQPAAEEPDLPPHVDIAENDPDRPREP